MERIPINLVPNFSLLDTIRDEAINLFSYQQVCPETLTQVEYYFQMRVEEEVAKGEFRPSFITPDNRVAVFKSVKAFQDEVNPTMVRLIPIWVYKEEGL